MTRENAAAKNALPRGASLRPLPHLEFVPPPLGTGPYNSGEIRQDGFIRFSRGRVNIIDRRGLESFACGCSAAFVGGSTPPAAHA